MIKETELSKELIYLVSLRKNPGKLVALMSGFGNISSLGSNLAEFIEDNAGKIGFRKERLVEAERLLKQWKKRGIYTISYFSEDYPKLLRQISDPPLLLYCKGRLPSGVYASIVGSRMATSYGIKVATQVSGFLSSKGIVIASGMAKGIDSAAHRAAINAGGKTVAVLGNGVDIVYPPENRRLYEKIVENGAVISEFEPGIEPSRWSFPQRNRIISGLSIATIVVEATKKSGALITARLAAKQGRSVMAVPGSILSETSRGTNALIAQGATPMTNYKMLTDELALDVINITHFPDSDKKNKKPSTLPEDEQLIYDCLNTPKTIDRLNEDLPLDSAAISAILTKLEIKDLITKQGSRFERKR